MTGGAGFIGRHVVKSFLKDHIVTIFDNFSNSSRDKILSLEECGVKVVKGDITNQNEIDNATRDTDVVIHLAAKISVSESVNDPSETFRVNVEGTRNVLAACEKNHIKKLVVASSAAVYGEGSPDVKLTEESETNPISPYGESKLKMEQEVREFASKYDIDYVILRFFNIYGIGQTSEYSGVITKFLQKIRQEKPLEVFGDGMQTRDFIAIEDVVDAINTSITNDNSGTYNIASGKAITIKELAEQMILWSGKKLGVQYLPEKNEDIKYSQADITMAKNHLVYSPKFELKEGIQELINNFNK